MKERARNDLDIPDGTRTRVLPFAWNALALLSYRFDNRSATARPKELTGKEGAGNPAILRLGRGLNPLAIARLTDNPNSAARLNWHSRWESNPRHRIFIQRLSHGEQTTPFVLER